MAFDYSYNDDLDESLSEENENEFDVRDSILFLVDASPEMFTNGYFVESLETFRNIVRQKCAQNRKEKMSLFIFGTKDTNCGIDNIMTLQNFETVTVDTLKNIQNILKDIDKYQQLASDTEYPLYNALTHAFQLSHNSKTTVKTRNIIALCTCNDNPCRNDPAERRRIEHLLSTFKDTKTELCVVGLSDSFNDGIFYKDLQIISGAFDNDTYRRIHLKDFEQNVLAPARSVCRVPWNFSPQISVEVSVFNLISYPRYPTKVKLRKDDNEILEGRHFLCAEEFEDNEPANLTEVRRNNVIVSKDDIKLCKNFSGQSVYFTANEHKNMRNMDLEAGIKVLAFKPIMCDPLYHVTNPTFVTCTVACNYEAKAFFMTFVSRCAEKKVMPVCRIIAKFTVFIAMLIPSEDDGGFYAYKIPFNDCVRDLESQLPQYVFSSENPSPVNRKAIQVFKNMMKLLKFDFDPRIFTNPKLDQMVTHLEALALDEKLRPLPVDSTLPPERDGAVSGLKMALIRLLNLTEGDTTRKRAAPQPTLADEKRQKLDFKTMAESKQLHTLTVADLKWFLTSIRKPTIGNKSNLIDRIYAYFAL